jgi:phosphatidylglycerol:prolipoprotein diacylglycerol transferase
MHPILFKLPLPNFNLPFLWVPLIVAVIAAILAAAKMVGKEKDRQGALIAGLVAVAAVIARFTVLKGNEESWNLGKIPIYSYGVMLGLSLVVGWYLTLGLAERDGLPKETMANNYVITAIAAVAGSRILYILTNLNEFDTLGSMFAMRRGGLVAYGGFLGGLAGSYFFLRRHKIPLLPWADVAVPSLASGLMITRIGCYLFGCDFGKPLGEHAPAFLKKLGTFPHWAAGTLEHGDGAPAFVQHTRADWIAQHPDLPHLTSASPASHPVHPTQIYESLVGAFLLVLLLWARRRQKFRGQIFLLFFFAYGVLRYLLEIIRDDAERGDIPPSLPEQVLIPLGLVALAIGWVIGFSKAIENKSVRLGTQVLAFVPAVVVYFAVKPAPGMFANSVQLSTSQFIALVSGVLASAAFAVFWKAAQAHPRQAMELGLPRELAPPGDALPEALPEPTADDEEEAPVRRQRPKKKKGKAKAKAAPKPEPQSALDEDAGEEERAPAAKTNKNAAEKDTAKDREEQEEAGDEPIKAG